VAKLHYKKIQEAVTFIKASREEAITLANDIVGDSEVHALFIQEGFFVSEEPVGYMVVPLAKEWVGLTDDEKQEAYLKIDAWNNCVNWIETTLREKNNG
jgi:hypothetical protein